MVLKPLVGTLQASDSRRRIRKFKSKLKGKMNDCRRKRGLTEIWDGGEAREEVEAHGTEPAATDGDKGAREKAKPVKERKSSPRTIELFRMTMVAYEAAKPKKSFAL